MTLEKEWKEEEGWARTGEIQAAPSPSHSALTVTGPRGTAHQQHHYAGSLPLALPRYSLMGLATIFLAGIFLVAGAP